MPYPGWQQSDIDQYTSIVSSVKSDPKYKSYSHDRIQQLAASIVNKRRKKMRGKDGGKDGGKGVTKAVDAEAKASPTE
jgi:hypothetical protein